MRSTSVAFSRIGTVSAGRLTINNSDWGSIQDWKSDYDTSIGSRMQ